MGNLLFGPWPPVSHANLSKRQLADAEGVTVRTVERWLAAGMPHERLKYPERVRFHLDDARKWLREQHQNGAA